MILALRPGEGLGWSGSKRYPMGGFVPIKGFVEQFEEVFIGGHRS
jgi:hypothetical protein